MRRLCISAYSVHSYLFPEGYCPWTGRRHARTMVNDTWLIRPFPISGNVGVDLAVSSRGPFRTGLPMRTAEPHAFAPVPCEGLVRSLSRRALMTSGSLPSAGLSHGRLLLGVVISGSPRLRSGSRQAYMGPVCLPGRPNPSVHEWYCCRCSWRSST